MQAVYLHGFASSARSTKAAFFAERLAALGIPLHTPDFNDPDFASITISRMVAQTTRVLDGSTGPAVLYGSSLGAFVGIQVAGRRPAAVQALVLLAPALDFGPPASSRPSSGSPGDAGPAPAGSAVARRLQDLGDRSLDEWRRSDRLEVFHYGFGRVMPIRYALYEDAQQYDAFSIQLPMPIQVFQGRRDTAVDPEIVRRWAEARQNVELHMVDDDHQLLGSLEYIWRESRRFLQL